MAEELVDPREVAWHPRLAPHVVGHEAVQTLFANALASGKPHHAWLLSGPLGIGKATLAYAWARLALGQSGRTDQAQHWIAARAHPDLAVLERSFTDTKPKRLRGEITVEDARHFIDFFSRTSGSGGWRVGLVDCADDLNTEAANALLKLVEEPPAKCLIFIVSHSPGKVLRTLRSRCMRATLDPLSAEHTQQVLQALPLSPAPDHTALAMAASLAQGSPGRALTLLNSDGAKAFAAYSSARFRDAAFRQGIAARFSSRAAAVADYDTFMTLLMEWIAAQAQSHTGHAGQGAGPAAALAQVHARLAQEAATVSGYNLDRRAAISHALELVEDALKVA